MTTTLAVILDSTNINTLLVKVDSDEVVSFGLEDTLIGSGSHENNNNDVHKGNLKPSICHTTVVPVMNGHPRDQAKVYVHCRWPLVTGTERQAGDAKYNTPCNTT